MSIFCKNEDMAADEKTAAGEAVAPKTDTKPETKPETKAPLGDAAKSPTAAAKSDNKH